ncbi:hypothetical protein OPQ81_009108 [Rhizoctonia solani]|nr:hypothetical protein OPQ81_009108 [Rhizoctonia solani]
MILIYHNTLDFETHCSLLDKYPVHLAAPTDPGCRSILWTIRSRLIRIILCSDFSVRVYATSSVLNAGYSLPLLGSEPGLDEPGNIGDGKWNGDPITEDSPIGDPYAEGGMPSIDMSVSEVERLGDVVVTSGVKAVSSAASSPAMSNCQALSFVPKGGGVSMVFPKD